MDNSLGKCSGADSISWGAHPQYDGMAFVGWGLTAEAEIVAGMAAMTALEAAMWAIRAEPKTTINMIRLDRLRAKYSALSAELEVFEG